MKPNYKIEFPDYDDTLPKLEGFSDSSWRNDACPSISREIDAGAVHPRIVVVFVDYKNPSLREHGDRGFRYAVVKLTPYEQDEMNTLLATDDWSEVVKLTDGIDWEITRRPWRAREVPLYPESRAHFTPTTKGE